MVYGTHIRLPGEFFKNPQSQIEPETFVSKLQQHMQQLRPLEVKHKTSRTVFIHKDLSKCTHVFLRIDRVKIPLQPLYEGPFVVTAKTDTYFTVTIKNKSVNVSIERLKQAYFIAADDETSTARHEEQPGVLQGLCPPDGSATDSQDKLSKEKVTRFHVPQQFDFKNGYPIPRLCTSGIGQKPLDVESVGYLKSPDFTRLNPTLMYGKVKRYRVPQFIPHFVRYDSKCLTFYAFFTQSVDNPMEQYRIRNVKIIYFLEDDTITVLEPPVQNSGFVQGKLIRRSKVPKNADGEFWHWKDFNIGMDIEFFGRVFHIVDCDKFTEEYLKSQGVEVNSPEQMPLDPYLRDRQISDRPPSTKTPRSKPRHFLENDGGVLRFYAAWDNRDSEFGDLRPFVICYYIADKTIEILEVHKKNDGYFPFPLLLKKTKLPKELKNFPAEFPAQPSEEVEDDDLKYYSPEDLIVGNTICILGRRFIIYDADNFTRQYYEKVLNITQPQRMEVFEKPAEMPQRKIPPYTGFGTVEDSYQSCLSLRPRSPKKDVVRYILNAKKFLRYTAKLDWVHPEDEIRQFIFSYSLFDGTVGIHERALCNSGIVGGSFLKPMRIPKPGTDPNNPEYYSPSDFYIGAKIEVFSHKFIITGADLFVYNYMQDHQDKFPPTAIDNIRNWLASQGLLNENSQKNYAGRLPGESIQKQTGQDDM